MEEELGVYHASIENIPFDAKKLLEEKRFAKKEEFPILRPKFCL